MSAVTPVALLLPPLAAASAADCAASASREGGPATRSQLFFTHHTARPPRPVARISAAAQVTRNL